MNTTSMHYSALEIWFRIKMLYMSVFGDTLTTGVELQNITRFTKLNECSSGGMVRIFNTSLNYSILERWMSSTREVLKKVSYFKVAT